MLIVNKIITQIFFLESEIRFFAHSPPPKIKIMYNTKKPPRKQRFLRKNTSTV